MASSVKYNNFTIYQGSNWEYKIQLKDTTGTVTPITGLNARFTIRKRTGTGDLGLNLTTANGSITKDLVNNKFLLKASATQTSTLTEDDYVYQFEVSDNVGNEYSKLHGSIKIVTEVLNG
jgi:hypothetical protein